MNWCCYLSTDQNQQKHWYDNIAQCLEWKAGCIFKFKTKLIFVFKALENLVEEAGKSQVKRKDSAVFLGSWLQVCLSKMKLTVIKILPSFSICIFLPLYFQRTVGGGELSTSQIMSALSPSVNSWGEGAFVKVIRSEKHTFTSLILLVLTQIWPKSPIPFPLERGILFCLACILQRTCLFFPRKVIKSPVLAIRKSHS